MHCSKLASAAEVGTTAHTRVLTTPPVRSARFPGPPVTLSWSCSDWATPHPLARLPLTGNVWKRPAAPISAHGPAYPQGVPGVPMQAATPSTVPPADTGTASTIDTERTSPARVAIGTAAVCAAWWKSEAIVNESSRHCSTAAQFVPPVCPML